MRLQLDLWRDLRGLMMKNDKLKTYHLKVKFMDELFYGQFITAPSEEEAMRLFIEEYIYIASERDT